MDTTALRAAYDDLFEAAQAETFAQPPVGEWDRDHLLAHLLSVDSAITAVALAVTSGDRPTYDNRISLDCWNLDRIVTSSGWPNVLLERVRHQGQVLCDVAEHLDDRDIDVIVPTLILSNDQVVLDHAIPLQALIAGLAEVHLPRHAQQFRALH